MPNCQTKILQPIYFKMPIVTYLAFWNARWRPFPCTGGIHRLIKRRDDTELSLRSDRRPASCWRHWAQYDSVRPAPSTRQRLLNSERRRWRQCSRRSDRTPTTSDTGWHTTAVYAFRQTDRTTQWATSLFDL